MDDLAVSASQNGLVCDQEEWLESEFRLRDGEDILYVLFEAGRR